MQLFLHLAVQYYWKLRESDMTGPGCCIGASVLSVRSAGDLPCQSLMSAPAPNKRRTAGRSHLRAAVQSGDCPFPATLVDISECRNQKNQQPRVARMQLLPIMAHLHADPHSSCWHQPSANIVQTVCFRWQRRHHRGVLPSTLFQSTSALARRSVATIREWLHSAALQRGFANAA